MNKDTLREIGEMLVRISNNEAKDYDIICGAGACASRLEIWFDKNSTAKKKKEINSPNKI